MYQISDKNIANVSILIYHYRGFVYPTYIDPIPAAFFVEG